MFFIDLMYLVRENATSFDFTLCLCFLGYKTKLADHGLDNIIENVFSGALPLLFKFGWC